MGVSNIRQRIAPVNPALVKSVQSRDPRLLRQTATVQPPQQLSQSQPIPQTQLAINTIQPIPKFIGTIPRLGVNSYANNTNRIQRIPRFPQNQSNDATPFNENCNKINSNCNNSIDVEAKEPRKESVSKSSRSSHKPSSKSSSSSKSNISNSSNSKSKSSSSSLRSSKSDRSSSRTTSSRLSSSSSSSKKSKSRKDDKSPRKYSNSIFFLFSFYLHICATLQKKNPNSHPKEPI